MVPVPGLWFQNFGLPKVQLSGSKVSELSDSGLLLLVTLHASLSFVRYSVRLQE